MLLTPGEPAGIGPDLVLMAARAGHCRDVVAVGDPSLLQDRADALGIDDLRIEECTTALLAGPAAASVLRVLPVRLHTAAKPGLLDPANANYVLSTLRHATEACLAGNAAALVTGPVQKSVINAAGIPFTGHTEYLSALCGGATPVMMLMAPDARPAPLRVALATTHLPLRAVADALSTDALVAIGHLLDSGLRQDFAIQAPCIKLTGLNPHAGESGHLGDEEQRIISPAVSRLQRDGIDARGPFPADTLFTPHMLAGCDAVLAMFHDQGLPALKYAGFGTAVNITLGLPIVRVSVDHGTALDRAGSGDVDCGSLIAALHTARGMVRARAATA